MAVRKNQNKLSDSEKSRFVNAVKKMKADAAAPYNYDKFVSIHATAFTGGPDDNPAHMGPAFFPWHRYFLLKFEKDLQAADVALGNDGSVMLPYWDWTYDNADEPNKQRGSLWRDDFLGGYGNPVTTGQFRAGQWALLGGGDLVRALGRTALYPGASTSLPTKTQIDTALDLEGFDCPPWDTSVASGSSLASPPPPVLTGGPGGGLAAGTYRVVVTYVNARGETRGSPAATVCLGGTCVPANAFNAIVVASPPPRPSATGYNVSVSPANGAAGTETRQGGTTVIGAPTTVTAVAAAAAPPSINTTGSFRNEVEGWISGPQNHNRVHMWVAGSMAPGTSPDDPVFFLHHCNVDRLWALWQFRHPGQNYPAVVPKVLVAGNRPHGLNDPMPPWTALPELKRPIDVLDHTAFYTYDSDPSGGTINVSP